jgi:hypothetical protein
LDLLDHRAVWAPHVVKGVVCGCDGNTVIPWLVSTFANVFPLVHDGHIVSGIVNWDFLFTHPLTYVTCVAGHEKECDRARKLGCKPIDECMWTPVRRRRRRQHGNLPTLWPSDTLLLPMPVSEHATTMWVVLMSAPL